MSTWTTVGGIRVGAVFVPETFGRLTTIGPRFVLSTGHRRTSYHVVQCCCGAVLAVSRSSLVTGNTRSCGCMFIDMLRTTKRKHGKADTNEYYIWQGIKDRCTNTGNSRHAYYGGRGIRVCDRWLEPESGFSNFLADMGERPSKAHSIDRYPDPNGNYCPENCRWATTKEQNRNQRSNVLLTYQEKTQCISAWAEELNMPSDRIRGRIRRGWSVDRTLATK